MTAADWPTVRSIYEWGIATGNATFQTVAPDWEEWNRGHLAHSRLVIDVGDTIVGWASLAPISARLVYRGVAEVSIYIAPKRQGEGNGRALLEALISSSEANGIWTLQAGIFPENTASCNLHERCGFRLVGVRERIGSLAGAWRDVCLYERRSQLVGGADAERSERS